MRQTIYLCIFSSRNGALCRLLKAENPFWSTFPPTSSIFGPLPSWPSARLNLVIYLSYWGSKTGQSIPDGVWRWGTVALAGYTFPNTVKADCCWSSLLQRYIYLLTSHFLYRVLVVSKYLVVFNITALNTCYNEVVWGDQKYFNVYVFQWSKLMSCIITATSTNKAYVNLFIYDFF